MWIQSIKIDKRHNRYRTNYQLQKSTRKETIAANKNFFQHNQREMIV